MTHDRVDRIMKKVEEYYRGDFLVNNDWEYSQILAKKYREQYANKYIGTNGTFGAGRMSCTEGCSRENGGIRIPANGIVFGPYFAFPAGDFAAIYDLDGDLHDCKVEVSSQKVGSVASGNAEDLLRNGKVVLPFSLSEDVPDLELKTINGEGGEIFFKVVSVSDHLETTQEDVTVRPTEHETVGPQESAGDRQGVILDNNLEDCTVDYVAGTYIQELHDMGRGSASAYQGLQTAAECELPQRTRFRRIKRFLRKLINCFIAFQLDFNRRIVAFLWNQNYRIQLLTASIAEEASETQKAFSESSKFLNKKIAQQNELISQQSEQIGELREELEAYKRVQQKREDCTDDSRIDDARLNALESELSFLTGEINGLKTDFQRWERTEQELLDISQTVGDLESDRKRLGKVESDLQELKENIMKYSANDTRLEEIGHLWTKIEDAIKLLHENTQK